MGHANPCHLNRDELLLGDEGCCLWTYVQVERQGKDQVLKRGKSISVTVDLSGRDSLGSCLVRTCDLVTELWPFLLYCSLCCVLMNCLPCEATLPPLFLSSLWVLALAAAGVWYLMRLNRAVSCRTDSILWCPSSKGQAGEFDVLS
jgi:hypothetical protein